MQRFLEQVENVEVGLGSGKEERNDDDDMELSLL